jgi:2-polyprenyl-3-methyl-5-hydroxy-6-metoxy-1,4-benzoquinol methylase
MHHDCGEVVDCTGCGLRYTRSRKLSSFPDVRRETPTPLPDLLLQKEADQTKDFAAVLDAVTRLGAGGRLLDIGSISGHFLSLARSRGFDVTGVEPDPWAAAYARKTFDLDIREDFVMDAGLPPASFGAIVMLHVMEHFTQPKETLAEIRRLLAPDGVLAVEVPIIDAAATRLMGRHHRHYVFDHTLFLTRTTCRRFLEEAGFRIVRHERTGRSLRLGRLARTAARNSPRLGEAVDRTLKVARLDQVQLTLNLRDILRVYAVREERS